MMICPRLCILLCTLSWLGMNSLDTSHAGNPHCWETPLVDSHIGFDRCCSQGDSSCWKNTLIDKDACCLDPDAVIFIPPGCLEEVETQLWVAGAQKFFADFGDRIRMSVNLLRHARHRMQRLEWALPQTSDPTIMDIGVGMGSYNPLINRYYDGRARFIYVDRSEFDVAGMNPISDGIKSGFNPTHPFYGNLDCAAGIARFNGIYKVRTIELSPQFHGLHRVSSRTVDLVISFFSWGFHYPIEMHLAQVRRILRPGGTLIITLRGDSQGSHLLIRSNFTCTVRPLANGKAGKFIDMTVCIRL